MSNIAKTTARDLLLLVNDPEKYDILQAYATWRIEYLHSKLEQDISAVETEKIRGAIKELRLFETLREQAIQDSK